jgi:hypothetical protein
VSRSILPRRWASSPRTAKHLDGTAGKLLRDTRHRGGHALYGLFADPHSAQGLFDQLSGIWPGGGQDVLRDQITRITDELTRKLRALASELSEQATGESRDRPWGHSKVDSATFSDFAVHQGGWHPAQQVRSVCSKLLLD